MSLSSSEVWQRIEREGLASAVQCRQWASQALAALPANDQTHGLKLLQRLVELKKLSQYQAKILAGQSTQPLRWGSWLILQRLKDPLWSGWYLVRPQSRDASAAVSGNAGMSSLWAHEVDAAQLAQLQSAAPSVPRGLKLAGIEHEALQATFPPELVAGQLLVFVAPISGQLLSDKFAATGCSRELALSIVRQVAGGLAAVHQLGLAHGRVLPDRIYWQAEQAVLTIDPLCAATATPLESQTGLIGQALGGWRSAQFLAPEFQVAGQLPTPATDIYALGCVWWWLLTGQPPTTVQTVSEAWQQQLQVPPQLPAGCELPADQWRCLQHALGRNVASRFPSAEAFLSALDAATNSLKKNQSSGVETLAARPSPTRPTPELVDATVVKAAPHVAASPLSSKPEFATTTATTIAQVRSRRSNKRRRGIPYLVPVLAGCGFVAVLLIVLSLSGALQPESTSASGERGLSRQPPTPAGPITANSENSLSRDPRADAYNIVATGADLLWAPPSVPAPVPIDLLPPGGQLFVSIRPADLMDGQRAGRSLLATFDRQLSPLLANLATQTGLPLEDISQITAAFYPPLTTSEFPQYCLRCELSRPRPLSDLKRGWQSELATESVDGQALLVSDSQLAYYIAAQPLIDSQSVKQFSVGPVDLMRDVLELQGAAGPLLPQLSRLWSNSDLGADVSLFASTPFLLTAGRSLIAQAPPQLAGHLRELLGGEIRGVGLQMRFQPQWYVETRFIGANDLKAGQVLAGLQQQLRSLPAAFEAQLISQLPDPYWRAIALRYPHMLRTFADYTRFGVEHGIAITNTYLPSEAASNVLLASWIAVQDRSLTAAAVQANAPATSAATTPLGIDEYLARPIRVRFDQEPIEVALALVAEEANDQLPTRTPALRFVLDGGAFEKAGITRNQQLRNFQFDGQAVRVALTEIAKRGNPVTTVTDLRQDEQRLVWVVAPDPQNPGRVMVSLTTRVAAQAAGIELPIEFRQSAN